MLMSLSEASIFFFSCLCRWQKRLFSSFRVYVVVRSDYFLHFVFMSLTEALAKLFFCLTEWCCNLKFLVSFSSNRKYRFQILFLKPTDRVEVGPWWCFYWYDDRIKSPFIRAMNGLFYIDKNDLIKCSFRGSFWTSCHFRMDMGR